MQTDALIPMLGVLGVLAACDPSPASDRNLHMSELREMEQYNARNAPTIPMSERVGCDVCPVWCPFVDLRQVPLPELFRDYREHATVVYDMSKVDNLEQRFHAKQEIHRISCVAMRSGPEARRAFLSYLDDKSPIVRVATADLALYRDIVGGRALRVLNAIQNTGPRMPDDVAFTAMVLLRKWKLEHEDPLRHAKQTLSRQPAP